MNEEQAPGRVARSVPTGAARVGSAPEPGRGGGKASAALQRGLAGLLARRGVGPRSLGHLRATRRHLPERRVYGVAARGALGTPLARRRLHWLGHPCAGELRRGKLTTPKSGKVRSVPMAPDVAAALARLGGRETSPATTTLSFSVGPGATSTARRCAAGTPRRLSARPTRAPLPRPATCVRHAHDREGRHPPCPGMDGPRRSRPRCAILHYAPRGDEAALWRKHSESRTPAEQRAGVDAPDQLLPTAS